MSEMLSDRLRDEVAELRLENEALRKDAERYRWLRSEHDLGPHGTKGIPWAVWVRPDELVPTMGPLFNDRLDAAIDAALAARDGA